MRRPTLHLIAAACLLAATGASVGLTPLGTSVQVNQLGTFGGSGFHDNSRQVDAAADGSFVVVWTGLNPADDPYNIYNGLWARRFDNAGAPLTGQL